MNEILIGEEAWSWCGPPATEYLDTADWQKLAHNDYWDREKTTKIRPGIDKAKTVGFIYVSDLGIWEQALQSSCELLVLNFGLLSDLLYI